MIDFQKNCPRSHPETLNNGDIMKRIALIASVLLILFSCACTHAENPYDADTASFYSESSQNTVENTDHNTSSDLKIIIGDVGKADFILLSCNGEYAVIDCGYKSNYDYIEELLLSEGVKELKYAIGTHPDKDHIGSMAKLIKNFKVEQLYISPLASDSDEYEKMIKRANDKGVPVVTASPNDVLALGSAYLTTYCPTKELIALNDENEASVVQMLTFGSFRMLFMADGQFVCESVLLNSEFDLSADIIKIAHHGSNKSSSRSFLEAVGAKYAVISAADTKDEEFPSDGVIKTLSSLGIQTYRTDTDGAIVINVNSNGFNIERGYTVHE